MDKDTNKKKDTGRAGSHCKLAEHFYRCPLCSAIHKTEHLPCWWCGQTEENLIKVYQ